MRFLLVDQILELDPAKSIVTVKHVADDEDYFADHFPGYPIVPGVLQVEMMAQSAGKCLMAGIDPSLWPVLIQVRQANFRKQIPPGTSLRIEAQIVSMNQSTASASGRIVQDGQIVSDASMVFGFISKTLLPPDFRDQLVDDYLRTSIVTKPSR